jgi:hypothetical protein
MNLGIRRINNDEDCLYKSEDENAEKQEDSNSIDRPIIDCNGGQNVRQQ